MIAPNKSLFNSETLFCNRTWTIILLTAPLVRCIVFRILICAEKIKLPSMTYIVSWISAAVWGCVWRSLISPFHEKDILLLLALAVAVHHEPPHLNGLSLLEDQKMPPVDATDGLLLFPGKILGHSSIYASRFWGPSIRWRKKHFRLLSIPLSRRLLSNCFGFELSCSCCLRRWNLSSQRLNQKSELAV